MHGLRRTMNDGRYKILETICEKIMEITLAIDSAVGILGFLRDH